MICAHRPPGRLSAPAVVPARARAHERGFTLVEILVVMIIIAIMMAAVLPNIRTAQRGSEAGTMVVAGGTLWRAINEYRLDYRGRLPAEPLLKPVRSGNQWKASASFVSPSQKRYLDTWPSDPRTGEPFMVTQYCPNCAPPPSDNTGEPHILYGNAQYTGWLAAYSSTGVRVFCRRITPALPNTWANGGSITGGQC